MEASASPFKWTTLCDAQTPPSLSPTSSIQGLIDYPLLQFRSQLYRHNQPELLSCQKSRKLLHPVRTHATSRNAALPVDRFPAPSMLSCKALAQSRVPCLQGSQSHTNIILGSSSVARRKILADMGYNFTIMTADIDEKSIRKEKPEELVMAIAEAKADAILLKLPTIGNQEKDVKPTLLVAADTAEAIISKLPMGDYKKDAEPSVLITCDQVVVYDNTIREKPSTAEEARHFIKGYSGGIAATVSSVIVTNLKTGIRKGDWDKVEIHFHDIPDQVIDNLIEEGDVLNVAGGLIIEHPLILPYVKQVVGTTDSVMGLPKALTERLMKEAL